MKFVIKPTNYKLGLCYCDQCDHCSTKCDSRCGSHQACTDQVIAC